MFLDVEIMHLIPYIRNGNFSKIDHHLPYFFRTDRDRTPHMSCIQNEERQENNKHETSSLVEKDTSHIIELF